MSKNIKFSLILSLGLVSLASFKASAANHKVFGTLDSVVTFQVRYTVARWLCSYDNFTVAPGEKKDLGTGSCIVNSIYAKVYDPACKKEEEIFGAERTAAVTIFNREMELYRAELRRIQEANLNPPTTQPTTAPPKIDWQWTENPPATGGGWTKIRPTEPAGTAPPTTQPITEPRMPTLVLHKKYCDAERYFARHGYAGNGTFRVIKTREATATTPPEYEVVRVP